MPSMSEESSIRQSRYKKSNFILGEGSYKTVYKAVDEEEGKEVAYNQVKIKCYEAETKTLSSFSKEIAILKAIDHPNIIKILDYWFTDDDFIFITELMTGGTLKDYIQKNVPLNLRLIRKWAKQILEGLKYLHNLEPPIIHTDIKNDNIFINSASGEIKIGDLGLARERKHKRYTIVCTPHFMAREMFEGEEYTEKVDIYAFGMGLIEMATGKTPYIEHADSTDIYKSVLQGIFPSALYCVQDSCLKSLILACLVPASYRYTASQCLDHHFFHTDVICNGLCANRDCVTVLPVNFQPVKDMELSVISLNNKIITFQILMLEKMNFIKFNYDIDLDNVVRVAGELVNEKIIEEEYLDGFSHLLKAGIETAKRKIQGGYFQDGMIMLVPNEIANIKDKNMIVNGSYCSIYIDSINKTDMGVEKDGIANEITMQEEKQHFGTRTLEEMQKIEEEMKLSQEKEEYERRLEEATSQRLRAKLALKYATFELFKKESGSGIFSEMGFENSNEKSGDKCPTTEITSVDSLIYAEDFSKALKLRSEVILSKKEECVEDIYDNFPSVYNSAANMSKQLKGGYVEPNPNTNRANSDCQQQNCTQNLSPKTQNYTLENKQPSPNSDIVFSCESSVTKESKHSDYDSCTSPKMSNATISAIQDHSSTYPIATQDANMKKVTYNDPHSGFPNTYPNDNACLKKSPTQQFVHPTVSTAMQVSNSTVSIQSPTASITSNGTVNQNNFEEFVYPPSLASPPFAAVRSIEDHNVEDITLNECYETYKNKYKNNFSITNYAYDVASNTGRSEDTAKSWIKGLKEENIETVYDLKLLVYEDWEKLPLTVFSCRAMQNTLYGIDGTPLKEKHLPMNPQIKEYENKISIKDFLISVCETIGRKDLVSSWENKLLAQDIRTVGELKSLHHDDWNRLGISVFAYRILKNVIFRKGKIMITNED